MKWKTKFIETMKRYKHAWVFIRVNLYAVVLVSLETCDDELSCGADSIR